MLVKSSSIQDQEALDQFDLIQKIAWNEINSLNIANKYKNVPKFNMEYHMLYVTSRKSFKVRK